MGKPRFIKIVEDRANCSLLLTFGSRKEASDFAGLIDEEVNTQRHSRLYDDYGLSALCPIQNYVFAGFADYDLYIDGRDYLLTFCEDGEWES